MNIVGMIPARMGSSRFPGKPLAPLLGRTMLEHVYKRTALSQSLSAVYVATCDDEIREAVEGFGSTAIMTSPRHERASDRIAEAMESIDADLVVMIQGDEPMVHPGMIDEAVAPFQDEPDIQCVNLTKRITTKDEFNNPNTIKVVFDHRGNALYMSRAAIPALTGASLDTVRAYKQVCIIPFQRDALQKFSELPPTPLEIAESVDMNRFLEHGIAVRMVNTEFETHAVDTPEDLAHVENLMAGDSLLSAY